MKKGFTLIEILLYIGLLSLFLFVLTDLLGATLDVRLESEASAAVAQDGRSLFARLRWEILQADKIVTPSLPGESSETLTLTSSGQTRTLSLVNGALVIDDGVTQNLLTSDTTIITSLAFTRLGFPGGQPTIQVNYTVQSQVLQKSGPEVATFQTSFTTR